VLTQARPILTLEGSKFLDPTLEGSPVDLSLTFKVDNLCLRRGNHVLGLNLGAGGVLISRTLRQRKHGHSLLADILDGSRRWRSRGCHGGRGWRLHRCRCGARCALLSCG
jgi:hypothetical protein